MSDQLRQRLFAELDSIRLIDPHSHIEPKSAASKTLADILGYHYYTELAHSAGMPRTEIEEPGLDPKEKVRRLVARLEPLRNTVQYSWLLELAREFFDFPEGEHLTTSNWESLFDAAAKKMAEPNWERQVLDRTKLDAVFLTNNFDDPLEGFDTQRYVPCLRTDDLVFHLGKAEVRQRLEKATSSSVQDAASLRDAIAKLFEHFTSKGSRACAISLPPHFNPTIFPSRRRRSYSRQHFESVDPYLTTVLRGSEGSDDSEHREIDEHSERVSQFVFWTLAEFCDDFKLPFDLMIGVNRAVYGGGVYQGQDLYDSRVSLIQYKELFNAFPQVTFPISVLASVTNQELVSYAWIFPNVVTNGHWWYSNTPAYIEHDAAARLEAVPQTKQIGYYSDAYKLEFCLPKFAMYKRVLAKILAERFVIERRWTEQQAFDLGRRVLRGNVDQIFNIG
ncbi:MAG TPA: glucuronate isomerase [Lacipirellulaceae bacterium]|jgi:glucuronate isomerase|nr:glucuronate isomerase [Lacipirellulaceae bacterium]